MAYSTPATVSDGNVAPATWGNSVKAATDYLANPPACRVFHNAAQSIPSNANTVLSFNSERVDTATMHDPVTNNSRITMNDAGLYVVTASVSIAAAADYTALGLHFRVNGANFIAATFLGTIADATYGYVVALSTIWKFAAADYVEAMLLQKNAAAAARNTIVAASYSPEFAATWIGLG